MRNIYSKIDATNLKYGFKTQTNLCIGNAYIPDLGFGVGG